MYAFMLAILGAVFWGLAPAFGKLGLRGISPIDGLAARTVVTVFFVGGWFLASGGMHRIGNLSWRSWVFLSIEAFLATFAGDLAYYAAIKWGEIGRTALVLAISPLVTVLLGWQFLGEYLSPLKVVGTVMVVCGIALVGLDS